MFLEHKLDKLPCWWDAESDDPRANHESYLAAIVYAEKTLNGLESTEIARKCEMPPRQVVRLLKRAETFNAKYGNTFVNPHEPLGYSQDYASATLEGIERLLELPPLPDADPTQRFHRIIGLPVPPDDEEDSQV